MTRAEQVRRILSTRGLTIYRLSHMSAQIFGRTSQYYVPRNFCCGVADPSFTPPIQQMLALSHITNYRLWDWLAVFGINLDLIPMLQLSIRGQRTTLLTSAVYDTEAWIPWFFERPRRTMAHIAPLGYFLGMATPKRAAEILALGKRRFVYARVGQDDVYAFPHLAPGGIVRVDVGRSGELPPVASALTNAMKPLFLIQHNSGWTCSPLVMVDKDRVLLQSFQSPCAAMELRLGKEARVVGVIDAEIRRTTNDPEAPTLSGQLSIPHLPSAYPPNSQSSLKDLLRISRLRVGLSFRQASAASRSIADTLSDETYFAAPSTLSDYETLVEPPRHIQKIMTLCVLYCIDVQEFLTNAGLRLEFLGRQPVPDEFIPREEPIGIHGHPTQSEEILPPQGGFLDSLMELWEDVPLFLRRSLSEIAGIKNLSLLDVFWVGGNKKPIHPWLINASFVTVNRKTKKPAQSIARSGCAGSLYLLLKRDDEYLCGPCTLQNGTLMVQPYPGNPDAIQQFRNGADAEVIGRITAILRRLS